MVEPPSHSLSRSDNAGASNESDQDVAIVQDPDTYFYNFQAKDQDSQWVRGLSPEDEDITTSQKSAELLNATGETEKTWFDSRLAVEAMLKYPLGLGIASVLTLAIQYAINTDRDLSIDFPSTEEALWSLGWQIEEGFLNFSRRVLSPLLLSVVLSASFCAWLAFVIGCVTHNFTVLCGVGTALLSVLALLMQTVLLVRACRESGRDFGGCEIPFVMYWICSVARRWCPMVSLWCVTSGLDRASCGQRWKYLMGIPVLALVLAVLASIHRGDRASGFFELAHGLQILIWSLFLTHLWRQKCIGGRRETLKSHTD